jgi:signal transduction histidine kinase/ActR/RegA family two-component response regulator
LARFRLLDQGIDGATARTLPTHGLRIGVTCGVAGLVAISIGWTPASLWVLAAASAEVCLWFTSSGGRVAGRFTTGARWRYFGSILWLNLVWWALALLFWLQGGAAFQLAAFCLLVSQMIHAQAFLTRIPAMLIVVGATPAALLVLLAGVFGGFEGPQLWLVVGGLLLMILYCAKAALTNAAQARALAASEAEAVAANRAKTDFLALMSHELRTPMTGVLGLARVLKLGDLTQAQREQVDLLLRSGDGLLTLLNDILDISKVESGKLELETVAFDITAKAAQVEALWSDVAEASGLRLVCEIDPPAATWLLGDPTRVGQVVMNLVSNALKFTATGEVRLTVRTSPTASRTAARVDIIVSDSGIGMTPAQQDRIFDSFTQADASVTRRFGGTGLGLSICRTLMQMMGGDLTVASELGVGSTFTATLELPYAVAPAPEPRAAEADLTGLSLLVVDDNPVNRLVVQTLLQALGCEVATAQDGLDALERLRAERFDVVLMDVHMPRMGGVEAVSAVRAGLAGDPHVPVIALTADVLAGVSARLLDQGFDAVQPKPISPEGLAGAIIEAQAARTNGPRTPPLLLAS